MDLALPLGELAPPLAVTDTDIQLKPLIRRIEGFNMKIIMRRDTVILFSK